MSLWCHLTVCTLDWTAAKPYEFQSRNNGVGLESSYEQQGKSKIDGMGMPAMPRITSAIEDSQHIERKPEHLTRCSSITQGEVLSR